MNSSSNRSDYLPLYSDNSIKTASYRANDTFLDPKSKEDYVDMICKLHSHNKNIRETFYKEKNELLNIMSALENKNKYLENELDKSKRFQTENLKLQNEVRVMKIDYETIIESLKNKNDYITKLKDENKSHYIKEIGNMMGNYEKEIKTIKNSNNFVIVDKCKFNEMESILKEIKKLELDIQRSTSYLKELELSKHEDNLSEKEMDVMSILEKQSEELLLLKKKSNRISKLQTNLKY